MDALGAPDRIPSSARRRNHGTKLESAEEPTVRISPHATSLRYGR
jgi:hypothetical protein